MKNTNHAITISYWLVPFSIGNSSEALGMCSFCRSVLKNRDIHPGFFLPTNTSIRYNANIDILSFVTPDISFASCSKVDYMEKEIGRKWCADNTVCTVCNVKYVRTSAFISPSIYIYVDFYGRME